MNYPGNLQVSLLEKYENQRKEREAKQLDSHDLNQDKSSGGTTKKKLNQEKAKKDDYIDREERMKQRMLNPSPETEPNDTNKFMKNRK